jgi:hypothetical protein
MKINRPKAIGQYHHPSAKSGARRCSWRMAQKLALRRKEKIENENATSAALAAAYRRISVMAMA